MDDIISATEANREFSRILRDVRGGRSYVITAHGKQVARIIPCSEADTTRIVAKTLLLQRLAAQPVVDIGSWTRDELYER